MIQSHGLRFFMATTLSAGGCHAKCASKKTKSVHRNSDRFALSGIIDIIAHTQHHIKHHESSIRAYTTTHREDTILCLVQDPTKISVSSVSWISSSHKDFRFIRFRFHSHFVGQFNFDGLMVLAVLQAMPMPTKKNNKRKTNLHSSYDYWIGR